MKALSSIKDTIGSSLSLTTKIARVWEETNPLGLAKHQASIIVGLTSSASSVQIKLYPMILETKGDIAVHIAWLED